ncbi:hypothetical protein [Aeromicrobium sp.]|uniref:hypothetical protein n=1 Tax=Aeromicrobium sp. TaxID=1871063 RepID=UPI00199520F8|nr:hypothetical protein [Aeromicrobium sp.]MBC7633166.1 hypothetical protein [Aeromicrobium sp.]
MSVPEVKDPASDADVAEPPDAESPDPDSPPNHADNNRWKQRSEMSPSDHARAMQAATDVRRVIQPMCAKGDFSPDHARRLLEPFGFETLIIRPLRSASGETPTGFVFAFSVGEAGCVVGSSRPGSATARLDGPTGEGTCFEPVSH